VKNRKSFNKVFLSVISPFILSSHIDEYLNREGEIHMRFIYKREPVEELQLELQEVSQTMCSGGLVLFDLLFYSLILTFLIPPAAATLLHFTCTFFMIYASFACLFFFVRRTVKVAPPARNYDK
jgi:hypothetical protein